MLRPMGSAVDAIKALKPYTFEFTNDPTVVHQGFFAHELQEQVPMAVSGTKDAIRIHRHPDRLERKGSLRLMSLEPDELTYEEEVEATPYVAAVTRTYELEYATGLVTSTKVWIKASLSHCYQSIAGGDATGKTSMFIAGLKTNLTIKTKALQELDRIRAR